MMMRFLLYLCLSIWASSMASAATFVVLNNGNSGPGTLRQAILDANAAPGPDSIHFNLTGIAPQVIAPSSTLPTLTDAGTVIDGGTQPDNGYSGPSPRVVIDGTSMGSGYLFTLNGAQCELLGLYVKNASYGGVKVNSSANGFRIGRAGNGCVVSLNGYYGINVDGADNGFIQGSMIGTDPGGTLNEGNNYHGILLEDGADNHSIGGPGSGEGNVIAANEYYGIEIECSSNNLIQGNFIGTNATETASLPNEYSGVSITFGGFFNNTCTAQGNVIGGVNPGEANVIANNLYYGINIAGQNVTQNPVRGNAIYCNNYDGLSLSDGNYGQPNGNGGIAAPNITSANTASASGTAPANATVDVYADDACSNCEPRTYLGSTTANASGLWTFTGTLFGNVTAIATDAVGNSSENSSCTFVSAGAPPLAGFSASSTSICAGDCVDFTDQSSGSPISRSWTFPGANTSTSNAISPTGICYDTPGTYSVALVVSNTFGTDSLAQVGYITVQAPPSVDAGPDQSLCTGDSVMLTLPSGPTYTWTGSSAVSDLGGGVFALFPTSTIEYVVEALDGAGCSDLDSLLITVNARPTVDVGPDQSLCAGDTASINLAAGLTYTWAPGTSVTDLGGGSFQLTPSSSTQFSVVATNSDNCTASDSLLVTVNPAPALTLGQDQTICGGDSATLNASGADTYVWMPGGLNGPLHTGSPDSSTTYQVTGTGTNGCSSQGSLIITVAAPLSPPSIAQSGDTLSVGPGSFASYQWYFNGQPITGATQPFLVINNAQGSYSVEVSNEGGCTTSSEAFVLNTELIGAAELGIQLAPNPGSEGFTLSWQSVWNDLTVYDPQGRLVRHVRLFPGQQTITMKMQDQPQGLYVIRLGGARGRVALRWQKR